MYGSTARRYFLTSLSLNVVLSQISMAGFGDLAPKDVESLLLNILLCTKRFLILAFVATGFSSIVLYLLCLVRDCDSGSFSWYLGRKPS